jgi:hypothetical protein
MIEKRATNKEMSGLNAQQVVPADAQKAARR